MSITAKVLINSKDASNSTSTEYTCPANTRTIIDKFTATNNDGSTQTISIYIVPSGGTEDNSNLIINAKSITTLLTYDFVELKNQILAAGDKISVVASVASKVAIRASGREIS